jgi:hypothetical protein
MIDRVRRQHVGTEVFILLRQWQATALIMLVTIVRVIAPTGLGVKPLDTGGNRTDRRYSLLTNR